MKPKVIIIAGPNGAGKTTFAETFLPEDADEKCQSRNPDIIASLGALKRAARNARRRSRLAGTPFWVIENGKIIDLNRKKRKTTK